MSLRNAPAREGTALKGGKKTMVGTDSGTPPLGERLTSDHEVFKKLDAGSYDQSAAAYDIYVRRLASPLAEQICRLARLRDGDRVLDVGTGSGLGASAAARHVAPSGSVIGIDLSEGMVTVARTRGRPQGIAKLEFQVMDAENLQFSNGTFDAVLSLCAVLHFPHITTALGEMYRVLKPGGRLVVSFGRAKPPGGWPLLVHYGKRAGQQLLRPIHPRMQAPCRLNKLAASLSGHKWPTISTEWSSRRPAQRLRRELWNAGCRQVRQDWLGHEVHFESAEDFVAAQTAVSTELRKALQSLPQATADRLRRALLERAGKVLSRGGTLAYPYGALYFSATRDA